MFLPLSGEEETKENEEDINTKDVRSPRQKRDKPIGEGKFSPNRHPFICPKDHWVAEIGRRDKVFRQVRREQSKPLTVG
jgi:hypothetical protein